MEETKFKWNVNFAYFFYVLCRSRSANGGVCWAIEISIFQPQKKPNLQKMKRKIIRPQVKKKIHDRRMENEEVKWKWCNNIGSIAATSSLANLSHIYNCTAMQQNFKTMQNIKCMILPLASSFYPLLCLWTGCFKLRSQTVCRHWWRFELLCCLLCSMASRTFTSMQF